ncbi:MAG: cobalt ECF transporter T component CbiQ, partial [Candidatus Vecturithrix sp.]|nr:cobalt ECF transporter T component CbiQ [Candidatus Vecturithrix sp.]
ERISSFYPLNSFIRCSLSSVVVNISRYDPRVRVITAFAYALAIAFSNKFLTLGIGLFISVFCLLTARTLNRQTGRILLEINLFVLFLFIFLPLSVPGTPVLRIGGLAWSLAGVLKAAAITLKVNAIMLMFMTLIMSMEPVQFGLALQRLGCPAKLSTMLFFTIRYLDVIQREYLQLTKAMKLRGFHPGYNRHTFATYGYLVGMLLVKTLDRAERIVQAMKCRGFRNRFLSLTPLHFTRQDRALSVVFGALILLLLSLEWF